RRRRLRHRLLTVCVAAMNVPRRTSVPLRNLSNRTSQSFRFLSLRKFISNKRPKFECPERVRLPPVRPVHVACRGGSGGGDMRHAQSRLKKASQERACL